MPDNSTTITTAAKSKQIVYDSDSPLRERFENAIRSHVGKIVKTIAVTPKARIIQIESADECGLIGEFANAFGIKVHCIENIYR